MRIMRIVIAVVLATAACKPEAPPVASGRAAQFLGRVDGHFAEFDDSALVRYRGNGFTFQYPARASREPGASFPGGDSGVVIRGIDMEFHAMWKSNVDPESRRGPSYELLVSSSKSRGADPFAGLDSAIRADSIECALDDCPIGFASGERRMIGDNPAYIRRPPCGDCAPYEVYFARNGQLVEFAFTFGDNELLSSLQYPLYWFMVSSFRWQAP